MNRINITEEKLNHAADEAYKSLRTNLQFCGDDKRVIAVTSCTPNEGKSNVCFHLAISLAEARKKVLLVDGDLRKSVLYRRIESEQTEIKGLSHFLSSQESLANVVYSTNIPGFHVIFAGKIPPNPAELLESQNFKKMIVTLRDIYDYVIIDTPPLGSVIDGAIIAEECDGSVFVIEPEVISYRFAQEVKDQLEKCNCPILGAVLNKVEMDQKGYYGKRYGKYRRYYGNAGYYGKGNYYGEDSKE